MTTHQILLATACILTCTQAGTQAGAQSGTPAATTVEGIYAEATADCARADNGIFLPGDTKVAEVDLTGDGVAEQIIDETGFACSTLASLYGGTGGGPLVVLANGKRFEWTTLGYKIVTMDYLPPVLLMSVFGGVCGGTGSDPCAEAVVWNGETFLAVRPAAQ